MILTYDYIKLLIQEGVIEGADESLINQSSMDVTLGDRFIREKEIYCAEPYVWLNKRQPFSSIEVECSLGETFCLAPGNFVLAHTQQIFNLPDYISAEYKLKSSMARIGLEHLNAGWCDPGWHGSSLTLELKNMLQNHTIVLQPGDRIGQVVFFKHDRVRRDKSYATVGRYNGDRYASGIKL